MNLPPSDNTMITRSLFTLCLVLASVLFTVNPVTAQSRVDYDYAYIGDPLPDPVMQQNKETYVLYGCAYCHGMYLAPVGEAADLRTSPLVAADTDANVIGPILRNGIPQTPKSSPMPQFSDLSEREIKAIASYIHYARAEERYKELMKSSAEVADVEAGKKYFESNCTSCHTRESDLSGIDSSHSALDLRKMVLKPNRFLKAPSFRLDQRESAEVSAGRKEHQVLLESYEELDVTNLVSYLLTLK